MLRGCKSGAIISAFRLLWGHVYIGSFEKEICMILLAGLKRRRRIPQFTLV